MRISPELRALRGDTASQRKAQEAPEAARDAWRDGPAAEVLEELARYGDGAALGDCPALGALFDGRADATEFLGSLVEDLLAALCKHPLGQVPLRHQQSDGLSVLQLAQAGRATLILLAYADTGAEPPASACFAGGERHEAVLAGAADVLSLDLLEETSGRAAIDCSARCIAAGDVMQFAGPARTKSVRKVHGSLVVLRLARSDAVPCDAREYALDFAEWTGRAHPSDRMRLASYEARAGLLGMAGRDALWREVEGVGSTMVAKEAARWRAALEIATRAPAM